jgi:hypothetical protein
LDPSLNKLLKSFNQLEDAKLPCYSHETELGHLPNATFSVQVLAPFFVVLKKFLHHFSQCTLIQLTKKHAQRIFSFSKNLRQMQLKATIDRKKRGTKTQQSISSAFMIGLSYY